MRQMNRIDRQIDSRTWRLLVDVQRGDGEPEEASESEVSGPGGERPDAALEQEK